MFGAMMVRQQNAVASVFRPVFSSQFPARWGTTRSLRAPRSRAVTASPTDDADLNTTRIYVDADACPVKDEIYRVAARHGLPVSVVAGQFIRVPRDPLIERIAAGSGMDAADDWIAERAGKGDIVITSDIPLASRCVKAGCEVIAPNGKPFTEQSIGMTLAVRNLMTDLRSSGEVTGGPRSFAPRDRSAFLSALDQTIRRLQRERARLSAPTQQG
jgi:uncharacterized protein YaiI (UPF0178 family)